MKRRTDRILTTHVGSLPRPTDLLDMMKAKLTGEGGPVDASVYNQKLTDAVAACVGKQAECGLDIITDGEMRRESYSNRFATALEGIDINNPGTALDRSGHPNPVPRIAGKIRRKHPVEVRDVKFLRANTDRPIKITVPGPFTMTQQAQNDFYNSEEEMAFDYAAAINEEIKDLFNAGADIVQMDETPVQVLKEPGKVARSKSYMWVMKGGPPAQPAIVYRYDPGRGQAGPGQVDGFAHVSWVGSAVGQHRRSHQSGQIVLHRSGRRHGSEVD